jgi:site-specific recombinase XerD
MLKDIFCQVAVIDRHRAAPLVKERERFLKDCADRGHNLTAQRKIAWLLLAIVKTIPLNDRAMIDLWTIKRSASRVNLRSKRGDRRRFADSSRGIFVSTAKRFFLFLGRFAPSVPEPCTLEREIAGYRRFMLEERGLSSVTVEARCQHARHLVLALRPPTRSMKAISADQIDKYLIAQSRNGWSRRSLAILASSLRCFFRFGANQHWCEENIMAAIDSPRIYLHETIPFAPRWDQVQQLIANTAGDDSVQIRDLAVLLLLAVYGWRRGEVAGLSLDDIDWSGKRIRVYRSKQRRIQQFPLVGPVGDAIVRYLRKVRPRCSYREVFLAIKPPARPLSASSISAIVRWRFRVLADVTAPRLGAHALRHACVRHLLTRGFSIKEIGDQLGHRQATSTLHYAKIDLDGLRQVAELNLRSLL